MEERKGKNAGQILAQNSVKSRRHLKHRGSGHSGSGPSKEQSLRLQLQVEEDEDIVWYSQTSRKKSKEAIAYIINEMKTLS